MKIALISPNRAHLDEMMRVLQGRTHQVLAFDGGKTRMRNVAEQDQPDLMVVDGMCCDPNELSLVEYVTTHHPRTTVVLLCASQTPEFLLNSMRAGVREVLPSPAPQTALEAAVQRVAAKLAGSPIAGSGKILAFVPCKGGSGATFLATSLAWELAQSQSVLLIDLNLQFGDALAYLSDSQPNSTLADIAHDIHRLDASFLVASTVKVWPQLHVLAAPEDASRAMEVKPEHVDAILNLAVAHYDFVLLDMGRVLDTLTVRALDRAHRIVPVLQPNVPSIRNAKKLMSVFRSLGYAPERIEPVVNRMEKSGEIGLGDIRRALAATNELRPIADSPREVQSAINRGMPLAEASRSNAVVRQVADWAASLAPRAEENTSFFNRLFGRA